MIIPGKGMLVLTQNGSIGTVIQALEGTIVKALVNGKEVLISVKNLTVLPNLGVGDIVENRRFGRGRIVTLTSALMVTVAFEATAKREGLVSLMDTRSLRLLVPAPVTTTAEPTNS